MRDVEVWGEKREETRGGGEGGSGKGVRGLGWRGRVNGMRGENLGELGKRRKRKGCYK